MAFFNKENKNIRNKFENFEEVYSDDTLFQMDLSNSLDENVRILNEVMGKNVDLVVRKFTLGRKDVLNAAIFYFDNLIDPERIDSSILQPLIMGLYTSGIESGTDIASQVHMNNIITRAETKHGKNMKELTDGILSGDVVLLIDKIDECYIISAKGYNYRNIDESTIEPTVKGPRDAFIELLSVNLALIRRRIKTPNLIFELMNVGKLTKTNICIGYIKGVCSPKLMDEVKSRIEKIDIDGVMGGNYIEEFIDDQPFSFFPQVRNTERPDVASAALLEGRVVVIIDNTPIAIIIPGEFFSLLQSSEDYYNRYTFSSIIRFLRYIAMAIALTLPSFYISMVNFHQEMIPTRLLVSIISARRGVPFPNFVEAFLMEGTFEILREAGVRLPRPVGPAVSIVGGLVIGQAAVQASIVSPLMVIIVSLTAISTFTIPQYNISLTIRILRFFLMILSAILGLYGLMLGFLFILLHLCSIRSFGVPYLYPVTPFNGSGIKDTLVRAPIWSLKKRPNEITNNKKRMSPRKVGKLPKDKGE